MTTDYRKLQSQAMSCVSPNQTRPAWIFARLPGSTLSMVSVRALWWAPVFVAFHDCIASLHWVKGRSGGDSEGAEGEVVVVERLSPRLYKYKRGEIALIRYEP